MPSIVTRPGRSAVAFLATCFFALGCSQPPLIPAPPDTGPELEALQLSQGLSAPIRRAGDPVQPMRLLDRLSHYKVPGVSIAVIDGGELRWAKSWGVVRAGSEDAVTPETLFQASSISKALTATAILDRVESGDLDLDADLGPRYADFLAGSSEPTGITARRLLTHTAGLNQQEFEGYGPGEPTPSLDQTLRGVEPAVGPGLAVIRPAGTAWQYSGGGFLLLQKLLEDQSRRSFDELMQESLLRPLAMDHSTFSQPLSSQLEARAALGHDGHGEPLPGGSRTYPELAAAGLWTTPTDLVHWLIDLQKAHAGKPGRILKRRTARAMLEPQAPGSWGLGIQVGGAGQARWMGHLGGNRGFPALALGFVSSGHGAVIMTNGDGGHGLIREIVTGLAGIYDWPTFQQQVIEEDPPPTPADDELTRWAGEHELGALPGQQLRLVLQHTEDGEPYLEAQLLGESERLVRVEPDRWVALDHAWDLRATSRRAEDSVVTELTVSLFPGYRFLATRRAPAQP